MESVYLLKRRGQMIGVIPPDPPKEKKPIAKRSEKMKAIMVVLSKLYPIFLSSRPLCEIESPECLGRATVVNHNKGRGIKEILDQREWTPCCAPCNSWIESHHAVAQEKGFKKSRHKIS